MFCVGTHQMNSELWPVKPNAMSVKRRHDERKAQNVNILFTKLFFCHTESKNVATTLICATGSHTKKTMACWLHSSYSNNFIGGRKKKKRNRKKTKKREIINSTKK